MAQCPSAMNVVFGTSPCSNFDCPVLFTSLLNGTVALQFTVLLSNDVRDCFVVLAHGPAAMMTVRSCYITAEGNCGLAIHSSPHQ